jgi:hypothetical protein
MWRQRALHCYLHYIYSLKSRSSREEEDNPLQLQPASIQTELISSSSSNSKPTKFREIQERYERDRSTSLTMASSGCSSNRLRQTIVVALLLLASSSCLASAKHRGNGTTTTVPFHGKDELRRYRKIMAQVARLKKASVKTIQAISSSSSSSSSSSLLLSLASLLGVAELMVLWCLCACRAPTAMSSTACRRTCSRRSSTRSCEDRSPR